MLYLVLTADHELFFGENYLPEREVLIEPTYKLMDILNKYNVQYTLMTDVLAIWKYRQLGMTEYPELVEEQLKRTVSTKNDVQLHIHPHWINSTYDNKRWNFDKRTFKIHDLGFEEDSKTGMTADKVIQLGKHYLEDLLVNICPTYKCIAFRAGGWCIQPEKKLLRLLKKSGIFIDTTIYRNGYMKNDTHYFDFIKVPDRVNWWINPDRGIYEESDADPEKNIFEVTIGSYNVRPSMFLLKIQNKFSMPKKEEIVRGAAIGQNEKSIIEKFKGRVNGFANSCIILSLEGHSCHILMKIVDYYHKRYGGIDEDVYLSIICHPKSLYNKDFINLEKFILQVKSKYNQSVQFITLQSVYYREFFLNKNKI